MATTKKKAAPRKSGNTQAKSGAGAAIAERSKDAKKPSFGTAAPKSVKAAAPTKATSKPASANPSTAAKSTSGDKPSMAARVMRKVKDTATIAVGMAASAIGRDGKEPRKAKGK
jgi:hypothetical protein